MVQDGMDMPGNKNRPQGAEQCGSHDKGSESQKVGSVGSMIISPLLHELPCETVGSFVFEHGLAVDCKDFGLAGDDMSCGLAVGCDSCTHEAYFCGLKLGHEVGVATWKRALMML